MSVGTSIEWTHIPGTVPATMNALVGCRKVSAGCKHCYAIGTAHLRAGNPLPVMQEKFGGTTERTGAGLNWTGKVTLSEKALLEPLTKRKPHTYFVNSMSDLFYEGVPDEWIDRHYAVFALCSQHTFIVLTKRPERMRKYLSSGDWMLRVSSLIEQLIIDFRSHWHDTHLDQLVQKSRHVAAELLSQVSSIWVGDSARQFKLPNVWHLVSVEDQKSADERIPLLLQTPSAVRGVSCEPLLGSLDLERVPLPDAYLQMNGITGVAQPLTEKETEPDDYRYHTRLGYKLDWVICGGESGAGARPMHPDWARGLRDQCQAAGVPFFFKQWGEWLPYTQREAAQVRDSVRFAHGEFAWRVGKKAAGHLLDGVEWHQFPGVRA